MSNAKPHNDQPDQLQEAAVGHLLSHGLIGRGQRGSIADLAKKLRIVAFHSGTDVVRQGDMGDALYIVLRGEADVLVRGVQGERQVTRLGPGKIFGEQAITQWFPRRRTATVRAHGELLCASLSRPDFVAAIDEITLNRLERLAQEQTIGRLKALSDAFATLPDQTLSGLSLEAVDLPKGGEVYPVGSVSQDAFIVLEGSVVLYDPNSGRVAATTGPGQVFGQVEIAEGGLRRHSAEAQLLTKLLRIPREEWFGLDQHTRNLLSGEGLAGIFEMPGHGRVLIRDITRQDTPALETLFTLPTGEQVVAHRLPNHQAVRIRFNGAAVARELEVPGGRPGARRLGLDAENRIISIEAVGPWGSLTTLVWHLLGQKPLGTEEEARLVAGRTLPPPQGLACACLHLTEKQLAQIITRGHHTPEAVMAACGAGGPCGACATEIDIRLPA